MSDDPYPTDAEGLEVCEGVESMWHYHLRRKGESAAICGRGSVMHTHIRLDAWDSTPPNWHIPETWCKRCGSALEGSR